MIDFHFLEKVHCSYLRHTTNLCQIYRIYIQSGISKNFPFLEVFLKFICDVFFINYYSIKIYKKYSSGISKS